MPFKIPKIAVVIIPLLLSLVVSTRAQDSLPNFSVDVRNGAIIIGWINPYNDIAQLIIQQSKDSISGFRSIVTMPDPAAVTNGFAYKKPNSENYYYRIFYLRSGSRYMFTTPKKPTPEIKQVAPKPVSYKAVENLITSPKQVDSIIKSNPSIVTDIKKGLKADSVVLEKIDSVFRVNPEKAMKIIRYVDQVASPLQKIDYATKDDIFNPSGFIFTNNEGNLVIALPDVHKKKFSLHVQTKEGTPVFEMKNIKEPLLQIDKSNFYKSGWFKYELYEAGRLREKNRFFIPADIK
ncbi:MAG: hypothetical protein KAZ11_01910 [Chitinophagaceae bacterium]|nr:hypothetical protein [Chitinophagaceae bacterium]